MGELGLLTFVRVSFPTIAAFFKNKNLNNTETSYGSILQINRILNGCFDSKIVKCCKSLNFGLGDCSFKMIPNLHHI